MAPVHTSPRGVGEDGGLGPPRWCARLDQWLPRGEPTAWEAQTGLARSGLHRKHGCGVGRGQTAPECRRGHLLAVGSGL